MITSTKYQRALATTIRGVVITIISIYSLATSATTYNDYQLPPSRNYSVQDGLAQVSIYDFAQDHKGFIWLGTQKGVDRFDGYDFINYSQNNKDGNGLSSDLVYAVEHDPITGDMWFGTLNGLNVLRAQSQKFELVPLPLDTEKAINSIYIDPKGNVFVGTQTGFYVKMSDDEEFRLASTATEAIVVEDINAESQTTVLAATAKGLYRYHTVRKTWELVLLEGISLESVLVDSKQQLWVGSIGEGLFKADLIQQQFRNVENISSDQGFSDSLINDVYEMPDGSIWVATTNGMSIFPNAESKEFLNYYKRDSNGKDALNSHLISLFSNDTGLVFFGTNANGFSVVDPNRNMFGRYVIQDNLHHYNVAVEKDDTLWIAAESGVWQRAVDGEIIGPYLTQEGDQTVNKVMSLKFDETSQTVWVATRLGLGKIVSNSNFIEYVAFENKEIYTLEIVTNGVWIGSTKHGLHFYDFEQGKITQSYETPMVIDIFVRNDRELMVATTNGIYLINTVTKDVRVITTNSDLAMPIAHNVITWLSEHKPGEYFVGLHSHGLMLLTLDSFSDEPKFKQLFTDSVLMKASIGAVVKDRSDKLWISTEGGIAKGDMSTGELAYFDETDGTNASGYYIGAAVSLSDGSIYFAGDQGITYFYPQDIVKNVTMPLLQITHARSLRLEDKTGAQRSLSQASKTGRITLDSKDIMLAVDFAALEYGSPDTIEYAYRLLGFDEGWQYLDSRNRTITYTNLDAGEYSLEIKSTNRYGVWNPEAVTLAIDVKPPWWKAPWALMLFSVLIALFLFLIFRWRTYALHKSALRLKRSVEEKTIELKQANARLSLLITLDPLTQVFNRRGFTDALSREFSRYQREQATFSIVLADIDFFKKINDENGHEVGDKILVEIARVLREQIRSYDILARWGGEEFIILLPNTKLPEAIFIANKYREIISDQRFSIAGKEMGVTLTAGVANISEHENVDACINHADKLLYEGKKMGRNQILPML
ncbi:diguanylate cyclase [Glaciecola sp. MH2013]|uniref:ligand-binding sensor domain-containing diguanylate cyclase n=1 Tax=Glaciecola sp. MH2013 TaxID=2785524 RepID=UPI0018A0B43C|nr:ligand-binding sensor domain-containing diguanylate cyclase [Glaciecola sp. MH2013]MBF7072384.1 diguanylate cyclase [Glaciecola sp. MH2013]